MYFLKVGAVFSFFGVTYYYSLIPCEDRKVVHLLPIFVFKSNKPEFKEGFLCTDWTFSRDTEICMVTESITAYISFCVDSVITKEIVIKKRLNNKPCVCHKRSTLLIS